MNTVDLINKVAQSSNLTTGRAEMIISIIAERITDTLKKEGSVILNDFGEFHLEKKRASGSFAGASADMKNHVVFTPDKNFLDIINS
jgi:nucleoid DNA-binding protein